MADVITHGPSALDSSGKGSLNRGSAAPAQSLGALLRQRREAMGVSLAEVEIATRIRQKYLAAIESDDWHLLPGEVVGRGFLRNYADYLGLEPHEVVNRRRAVTDPGLVAALASTSSGASLPAERQVDYRPKEVELKDDVDGIQRGEIRLTPILSMVAVAALVALAWLGATRLREPIVDRAVSAQTQLAGMMGGDAATATPALIGIVNTQNVAADAGASGSGATGDTAGVPPAEGGGPEGASGNGQPVAVVVLPTMTTEAAVATDAPASEPPTATLEPPTPEPPTPEPPTPEPPTPEPPTPEPPTPTPIPPTPVPEVPTETPAPEPPPVLAAACADGRSVIFSPGVNQVVSGILTLTGTASHSNLDYYKLEYAPGANAAGGFVYFDGQRGSIDGGTLGSIDTRNLPNGEYTLRVTVVDQTGNFPPPCDVTVIIQN